MGLDPRFDLLPSPVIESARQRETDPSRIVAAAFEEFCFRLIDVVAPLVPAVKPQAAFFEQWGPAGCLALARVMRRARDSGLIVICDAKRGDIGSTAEAYAQGYLAGADPDAAMWSADALTVNPYLGPDTLEPFVKTAIEREAGIYVLVRTSNPGSSAFQARESDAPPLYRIVAESLEAMATNVRDVEDFGAVGAVVGATHPEHLVEMRQVMPHVPFLVPGYGSQGGRAKDVAAAFTAQGLGALVNSSRAINFAHAREPYASQYPPEKWEQAVQGATNQMIAELAAHTPAGKLLQADNGT